MEFTEIAEFTEIVEFTCVERETGTVQQVTQLHDIYDDDDTCVELTNTKQM
jgi:hypothetical protein